jgi:hypothetical protein
MSRPIDVGIRWAILEQANARGPLELNDLRRRVESHVGLGIGNRALANMTATLHRAGFVRYCSADGLRYGNHHAITEVGKSALRYLKPEKAA